jgi:hypothetical protein
VNGPPGIGKSTLAAVYIDRHPGTLGLDIDNLHQLVGGWQDPDAHTHEILRPVALAMASAHLAGGQDVILPQYLARIQEIERFEHVASERGAGFREVVLLDDKAASIASSTDGRTTASGVSTTARSWRRRAARFSWRPCTTGSWRSCGSALRPWSSAASPRRSRQRMRLSSRHCRGPRTRSVDLR